MLSPTIRRWLVLAVTSFLLLTISLPSIMSPHTAYAQATVSTGRVCMINAPNGVVPGGLIGHVGWAYKSGSGDQWTFGATEGTGAYSIPPGKDTHSWYVKNGTWDDLLSMFSTAYIRPDGVQLHPTNYYTQFRCRNVSNGNESNAFAEVQKQANNGYDGLSNNCLTKSVAILRAYGVTDLPNATKTAPNDYFGKKLAGFEVAQGLAYVTLSQSSGSLNTWFKAFGKGWPTNVHVVAYWPFGNANAEVNPDSKGNFTLDIQVPGYAQPGTYQLMFDGIDGWTGRHTTVYKTFQITSKGPQPWDCNHLSVPAIAFYAGKNFVQPEICFEGSGSVNLQDYGWANRAQSINLGVHSGCFYDGANETGNSWCFSGSFTKGDLGSWNQHIVSFQMN